MFFTIARWTQKLNITAVVRSAARQRLNMIDVTAPG